MTELTINQALQQGVEAHKAGRVQEADRLYTAILKAQPKHPDANHNMGVLAVGVGKVEKALPFFKTALEANPATAQFWLSYIGALIKLEQLADAKAVLDQAKSKGAKGDGFDKLQQQLKKLNNEYHSDDRLIETLETNHNSTLEFAIKLRETGEFNQAIDLLKDKINRSPDDADMLAVLSHCYLLTDQVEKAKLYLNKAREISSNNASVGWNTARLMLKEQTTLEALNVARDTVQRFPDDVEGMGVLGACLRANGETDESLKVLNRTLKLNPNYAEALINRGLIRLSQKNKLEALDDLELAHRLKPYIKQIWDLVVELKVEQQGYSGAVMLLKRMIEIEPENEKRLTTLALCYQHSKNFDLAIEAYNKALAINPVNVAAQINLGSAFKEKGKLEEAIEAYKKAIIIKPGSVEAYNNLGITLIEQGNLEEAIEACNEALAIKPDYANAYNNIGNAHKRQGKLEEAIRAYNKALAIKPDYADAIENSRSLAVQLLPVIANYGYDFNSSKTQLSSEVMSKPRYLILNSIKAYLEADFSKARADNNSFQACDKKIIEIMMPKNQIFCDAYSIFIGKLLDATWEMVPVSENKVYHLGESHSLSYAHRHITTGGLNSKIVPRITFGAKAFHLARTKQDIFKAITKAHFVSLPRRSKVFLSYGEIDCRPNEGFISAAIKFDKPLDELIDQTAEGYVQWFLKQNVGLKHHLFFINVPAPVYDEKLSTGQNLEVAKTVTLFNAALKQYSRLYGFNMVDVFNFTTDGEGFSNGLFHVDNYHLGAQSIAEIEKQLV
ncbi:tetratricopeptide repeat protein [Planktomarina temperata]|nr:tetratricopeptide repeat protein [Planktomarina temperata]